MLTHRREALRILLLSGSGILVFLRPAKVFSRIEAVNALLNDTGIAGAAGELHDVAFAIAGMT